MIRELRALRKKLGREKADVTDEEYKQIIAELSDLISEAQDREQKVLIVRHYASNKHPCIIGLGHEIDVAEDREDVEEFCSSVNGLLASRTYLPKS